YRVSKKLQRERRNGLIETMVPKTISESREKKRRGFAADTSEREQNPGDDPLGRGLHHNMDDCFPTANAKRERGFAVSIGHKKNNFLRRAQDQRNHDQAQCKATSVG